MPEAFPSYVLTLSCPDRKGIVAAVSSYLRDADCNILDSAQFDDPLTGLFFLRIRFQVEGGMTPAALRDGFAPISVAFAMHWDLFDLTRRVPTLIAVSKSGHCLNDLLYRIRIGALPIEARAIVSNHSDMVPLAAAAGVPYVQLRGDRAAAGAELLALFEREGCELLVLARYMQILPDTVCAALAGRAINIHHSFLPSFKGAKPYHQAHARGVKLIGATAHYVTAELDEGPIIEQETIRVDHSKSPADYVAAGRDVEAVVLARAVTWHAEHRVLMNGDKTVVFK